MSFCPSSLFPFFRVSYSSNSGRRLALLRHPRLSFQLPSESLLVDCWSREIRRYSCHVWECSGGNQGIFLFSECSEPFFHLQISLGACFSHLLFPSNQPSFRFTSPLRLRECGRNYSKNWGRKMFQLNPLLNMHMHTKSSRTSTTYTSPSFHNTLDHI